MSGLKDSEVFVNLLNELESKEAAARLKAIKDLGKLDSSNREVVRGLENIAVHDKSKKVRKAAISALTSKVNRNIFQRSSTVSRNTREIILAHMKRWEADNLISPEQAEVLQGRYNFDLQPSPSKSVEPIRTTRIKSPQPKRSIGELLLSESTIKIALYLGAFFVIAASFIFAAAIENLRIPILLVNTAIFLTTSAALRKRLPQASYVLFIIFSFMLITDASVIDETLNLSASQKAPYWFFVAVIISIIWAVSTYSFESTFFSLASFVALSFAAIHLGNWINVSMYLTQFFLILVAYVGLFSTRWLQNWKDTNFAKQLFYLTQFQLLLTLLVSLLSVGIFAAGLTSFALSWWLMVGLNLLLAAGFFALSNKIIPSRIFPYLAIFSLIPVPWFLMKTFSTTNTTIMVVMWVWATLFAVGSEIVRKANRPSLNGYSLPLLLASAPLYVSSIALAGISGSDYYIFSIFSGTSIVFGWLHFRRPRHIIWFFSLLLAFRAYLAFFNLPIVEDLDIFPGFVLLLPTIIFLAVDLSTRKSLNLGPVWYASPRILSIFIGSINFLVLLTRSADEGHLVGGLFLIYSAVIGIYAIIDRKPILGYLATGILVLSEVYFLNYFEETALMAYLMSLASIYFLTGLFLKGQVKTAQWAYVMRYSGLALAILVSLFAPIIGGLASIVVIAMTAIIFAVEAFTQRKDWAGYIAHLLILGTYYRALSEYDATDLILFSVGMFIYYLLGFIPIKFSWSSKLASSMRASGLALGVLISFVALFDGEAGAILSVTLAAAAFTIEAFYRKNVMLGFPANLLYLEAYFLALLALDISQPQFYSMGAAIMGIIMHYILAKRKINISAFNTGMLSQLILLSTTYLQMISTGEFQYFFILFFQSLAVIAYGTTMRSRSLVFTPVAFLVLAVVSIIFDALSGLGALFIVCSTGFSLLAFGIIALTLRERFTKIKEGIEEKTEDWVA